MPRYLAAAEIRAARERLAASSARSRLLEFLIGLRTLSLAGTAEAAVAESSEQYLQALNEFSLWVPDDQQDVGSPYFNPFDSGTGYKSPKFRSNGPGNTMHNWATQVDAPFSIDGAKRPKTITRIETTEAQLRKFLLAGRDAVSQRPRLIDAAVWFYRETDLDKGDGAGPDRAELEEMFAAQVGLTTADIAALFLRESDDPTGDPVVASQDVTEVAQDA